MKRIISLLLACFVLCTMSVGASALRATNTVIPTATLNPVLSDYRTALKNGETYVSLAGYGLSGAAAADELYDFLIDINGDLCSISYGKYSETYVVTDLDQSSSSGPINGITMEYNERYRKADGSCDRSIVDKDQAIITERYNAAKRLVKRNMSDAEKALILYDYIISAADYAISSGKDETGRDIYDHDAYTAVGFMRDCSAVCAAYAKLYAALLNDADVPAITVDCDDIDHEWVMVQIDGEWYHADPTWDDIVYSDGYTALWDMNNDDWDIGAADHYYFLKSDEEFVDREHPNWKISYSVNPKMMLDVPESGPSGAFDDKFFSDMNENYLCCTVMNYINGSWYFADLKTMSIVCATYDGDTESIPLPDGSIPKYCFGYNNDLYICTNFFVYRYDTLSGSFDKLIAIPEEKRETDDFSEMRILYDEMTLVTASYTFDDNGDYTDAKFTVDTYPMSELSVQSPLTEDGDADLDSGAEVTRSEEHSPAVTMTRPDKSNDSPLSPEDKQMIEMAEAAGRRISAMIYLGVAALFIIFGVIAVILAVKYSKKK